MKPNKQCKQIWVSSPPSSIQTSTTTTTNVPPQIIQIISYPLPTFRALVSCTRQDRPLDRNCCLGLLLPISLSSSAISNCCISITTRIGPTSPSGRCRPRRTTSASESRLWNGRCTICAPSGTQILHRMYVVHPPFLCETCQHSAVQPGLLTGR